MMMKRRRFRIGVLLVLASCISAAVIAGPSKDFEKIIEQEYPISADGRLEVLSKYGNVDVKTWSEMKVKIVVTIKVDARNQEKADEVLSRINVNFSNTSSLVRAATEISTEKSWSKWFGSNSDQFEINYNILIPESLNVSVVNKYGAIYLASIDGSAEIKLKYGKLQLEGIGGDLDLSMGYSKGSLTSSGNLDLSLSYSNLKSGDLGNIIIESKYSHFEATSAGTIQSSSSYDEYDIGKAISMSNVGKYDNMSLGDISEVTMTTKYTHLDIGKLTDKAALNFKYGGIKIGRVSAGFSRIEIESGYTSVTMTVDPTAKFNLDATGKYSGVKYTNLEVYQDIRANSDIRVKGYRGEKDGGGIIVTNMKYGGLKIY
jgi:hypothetical protein